MLEWCGGCWGGVGGVGVVGGVLIGKWATYIRGWIGGSGHDWRWGEEVETRGGFGVRTKAHRDTGPVEQKDLI